MIIKIRTVDIIYMNYKKLIKKIAGAGFEPATLRL